MRRAQSISSSARGELGSTGAASLAPAGSTPSVILSLGDTAVRSASDLVRTIDARKPGDRVAITFDRHGQRTMATVTLEEDPRHELVPVEQTGASLTEVQRQFRQAWLSSQVRNSF